MFPLLFTTEVSPIFPKVLQAIQFGLIDKCLFQKHRLHLFHTFLSILDVGMKTTGTKISYSVSALRSLHVRLQTQDVISNNGNRSCG